MPTEPQETSTRALLAAGAASATTEAFLADGIAPDLLAAVVPDGYQIAALDIARHLAPLRSRPRRTTGTVEVLDAPSFLAYWGKYSRPSSEVYADVAQNRITAVLNAPAAETSEWADHRVVLRLESTPAWWRWTQGDRQLMPQARFAEHVEDSLPEIVHPDAATMLELVQSFEAATKVEFKSGTRLSSGERRLVFAETTVAKAGQTGDLVIPAALTLRLQPFKAGEPVDMTARFRYRIIDGSLSLGYVLDRPDEAKEAAFGVLVAQIAVELGGTPIFSGPAR